MQVLHVHSGNLYGGVETFLTTLARFRHLAPSMQMHVALCWEGRIAGELQRTGIDPVMLGAARLTRPDQVFRARACLHRTIERVGAQVLVCHQAWPYLLFGPVARAANVRLAAWVHMAYTGHWLERLAWRQRPDVVICNSRFTASTLPRAVSSAEVIYMPVAPPQGGNAGIRKSLGATHRDVVIIQVSRMEPLKGHNVCLEALARLRDVPGWTCWQVGGAQRAGERRYLSSLLRAAERLGIGDRVHFLGERTDVGALLDAADVFCQPNVAPDAFGISCVEALLAGTPVVTSAIGGPAEIVDDSCGVLLPPGDAAALARALQRLIADGHLREQMGREGIRRATSLCNPAVQVPRIAHVLERACA